MTFNRNVFSKLTKVTERETIATVDNKLNVEIHGQRDVELGQKVDGNDVIITLKDVAYAPKLRTNLVSQKLAQRPGITLEYPPISNEMIGWIRKQNMFMGSTKNTCTCELIGIVPTRIENKKALFSAGKTEETELVHRRMCHMEVHKINEMSKNNVVDGLKDLKVNKDYKTCVSCTKGKNS